RCRFQEAGWSAGRSKSPAPLETARLYAYSYDTN
ncbi:hypothetical protein THAOC_24417, partial [Thalassiosira oceanica]